MVSNEIPGLGIIYVWVCGYLSSLKFVETCCLYWFNAILTAKVISWRLVTHMCFLAFSQQYQHTFLSKSTDYFSRMRKYAGKKFRLNRVSNSQPPGCEPDMLTTEPPRRGSSLVKHKSIL